MTRPAVSRARGIALAAGAGVLAAVALAAQSSRVRDPRLVYTRFELPAFDAYAYVAMAEEPRVFTVAPWGYRVLTPALAHAAALGAPARVLRGFRAVNGAALVAAAVLLWLFQRRLGLRAWAALAGVIAFALAPPVAELLRNPFLADAVLVALETAFLLALQAGAGAPALALLAGLGALAKESFLLLLPVAFLARRQADGRRRALLLTACSAAAAVTATVLLRGWWTPHLEAPAPGLSPRTLVAAAANLRAFLGRQPWGAWLLLATGAVALLAARRPQGRGLLARYGYVALAALAAPFFNPVVFSIGDVRRLVVHALPVLVPLAVAALPGAWRTADLPAASRTRRKAAGYATVAAAVAAALSPLLLDRYRRADLQGPRDGPRVLAFCRESLRAARRLDRGEAVTFDLGERSFQWGISDPGRLDRMRWFLGEGWGGLAHYGAGEARPQAPRAELIVPVLRPRDLDLTLALAAPDGAGGALTLNGRPVGSWAAATARSWRLPAAALVRGDNVLAIAVAGAPPPQVRLDRVTLAPAR
ncbi:MAG TPA: hypothetical protein VIG50_12360 [Vicinamibacteria bacterium]